MNIEITKEEITAIENAWKLVRNKITGGTNEENKFLENNIDNILKGLRILMDKTKNTL
jgi:hypothetical protein